MAELDREEEFSFDDIKIHSAEVVDKPIHASPYATPVEIIVEATAWNNMNRHACEDMRYEAGGVMLGGIYDHGGTLVVRITTAVAARDAVNSVASIQFTYDAWSQMEKEREQNAPGEKLLGWYHTHPGFSAFFSDTDRFLHEHFFTQPWHIALVIDPIRGDFRFYRWDDGRVREVKDFLLKVDEWPGPQPPLGAIVSAALRRAARQADAEDAQSATPLRPALEKVLAGVRRISAERPSNDLLPLIISCAELPAEVVAEAKRRMEIVRPGDDAIHYGDLEVVSNNSRADGPISISRRWLVQQNDWQELHVHSLDVNRALCARLSVSLTVQDLTLTEASEILVLTRADDQSIYRIDPPLERLPGRKAGDQQPIGLTRLELQWGNRSRPTKIGKVLAARHDLFLLTRNEIWMLEGGPSGVPRFEVMSVHPSTACNWDSFADLIDWTCDPIGNLYLLSAGRKEVWRYERLVGRWSRLLADEKLDEPRSLAAGGSKLSIYDGGKTPSIVQYSLSDGGVVSRRTIDRDVQQLRIWHLFSDGAAHLYLVTEGYVFQFR